MDCFGPEGNRVMSYILDALKKLEHEKTRKSRGDGMVNISGALFENERPRPSGTAGRKIALAVTVAVLVTFGATWFLLRPVKGKEAPVPRLAVPVSPPAPVPPVAVEPASLPAVPPAVTVQQVPPPAVTSVPVQVTPVRPPAPTSKSLKAAVQAAPVSDDDDEGRESRRRTKERKGQSLASDQATAAPADIRLSGIAWQEERRARRAVVNGFLMQEGGLVAGARITDIYQDRVRFSLSGKFFEIPLVSSPVPAAGK
jgi:general secretion pathway protein B